MDPGAGDSNPAIALADIEGAIEADPVVTADEDTATEDPEGPSVPPSE